MNIYSVILNSFARESVAGDVVNFIVLFYFCFVFVCLFCCCCFVLFFSFFFFGGGALYLGNGKFIIEVPARLTLMDITYGS